VYVTSSAPGREGGREGGLTKRTYNHLIHHPAKTNPIHRLRVPNPMPLPILHQAPGREGGRAGGRERGEEGNVPMIISYTTQPKLNQSTACV